MRLHVHASRRAFTLIELLAVIAIVGVLAALLFPLAREVRARGQAARCASDLRQIGVALLLYADEHRGRLPSSNHDRAADGSSLGWTHTLAAYLGPMFLGRCPAVPDHPAKITYAWNDLILDPDGAGVLLATVRAPAATLAVAELAPGQIAEHLHFRGAARGVTSALFQSFVHVRVHGAGANYLFVDGHVRMLPWPDVQRRLADLGGTFLQP